MKYTSQFAEKVRELDTMVLLQKEYDLYEHKKRHIRKMMALHQNPVMQTQLEQDFREVVRHMKLLERQMKPQQNQIDSPRHMISCYMNVYQVSIPSVARILKIKETSIYNYLTQNNITPESRTFIYWAIRNFRLDANRYWKLIDPAYEQAIS